VISDVEHEVPPSTSKGAIGSYKAQLILSAKFYRYAMYHLMLVVDGSVKVAEQVLADSNRF
jgi:hypothetical protein